MRYRLSIYTHILQFYIPRCSEHRSFESHVQCPLGCGRDKERDGASANANTTETQSNQAIPCSPRRASRFLGTDEEFVEVRGILMVHFQIILNEILTVSGPKRHRDFGSLIANIDKQTAPPLKVMYICLCKICTRHLSTSKKIRFSNRLDSTFDFQDRLHPGSLVPSLSLLLLSRKLQQLGRTCAVNQ